MPNPVYIVDGHKPCGKCKHNKPVEAFRPNAKTVCGLRSYCIECETAYYRDSPNRKAHVKAAQQKRLEDPAYKAKVLEANRLRQRTEAARQVTRANNRKRRREDPQFRLRSNLATGINTALRNAFKSGRTLELLGCTIAQLKAHLESLWKDGMSWENWGRFKGDGTTTWHIDHILPCAAFDLTKAEEQRKCFHWSNLQPLWAIDNNRKGGWVPDYQI